MEKTRENKFSLPQNLKLKSCLLPKPKSLNEEHAGQLMPSFLTIGRLLRLTHGTGPGLARSTCGTKW